MSSMRYSQRDSLSNLQAYPQCLSKKTHKRGLSCTETRNHEQSRKEKMKTDVKSLDVIKLPAIGDAVSNGLAPGARPLSPRAASAYRRWMRMRR